MPHDDFHVEPVRGLPERPPEGERILWQGGPSWKALAQDALSVRWVIAYFALLAVWRAVAVGARDGAVTGLTAALPFVVMGAIAVGLLVLVAVVLARTTVYTITNRRVAMRIGAALTVTLNIPFTQLGAADLGVRKDGSGSIYLSLLGETRLSYLVCWPHVRPWRFNPTQPALRSLPDVKAVAAILGEAAKTRVDEVSAADAHLVAAE